MPERSDFGLRLRYLATDATLQSNVLKKDIAVAVVEAVAVSRRQIRRCGRGL